jgi:hypothetical protein
MLASRGGHVMIVDRLLQAHADINCQTLTVSYCS